MKGMVFKNYGGIYQLRLEKSEDLAFLPKLKAARWAATSAPLDSFQCDPEVLKHLDSDSNGRLRTQDFIKAQEWLFHYMSVRSRVAEESDRLRLSDINTHHKEGENLRRAAELTLKQLGEENADEIELAQVRTFKKGYAATFPNGDGIVPLEFVQDPETAAFCQTVFKLTGGTKDAAGKPGFTQAHLDEFQKRAQNALGWMAKGKRPEGEDATSELWRWGDDTSKATALVFSLDEKIQQYFSQCDLVKHDPRAVDRLKISPVALNALDVHSPAAIEAQLKASSLTPASADGALRLNATFNPIYSAPIEALVETVLRRALGDEVDRITREDWAKVKALFTPHKAWLDARPNDPIVDLGEAALTSFMNGPCLQQARDLVAKDLDIADELKQIDNLEKLILFQRWLLELTNNFVNFSNLYDPDETALFERGTLVIDGRALAFTMRVRNRAEHKKMATSSKMYLVYAEVTAKDDAKGPEERFDLVAAVTSGQVGGIGIGKRGVYFDTKGNEWDARVVDVVTNPVSLWEAIKAPFEKARDMAAKKIEQFAAKEVESLEKATDKSLKQITEAPPKGQKPPPKPPAPPPGAKPGTAQPTSVRDLLLGGGFAFAAVGSSLAFMVKTLSEINPVHVGIAVFGLVLVVVIFSGLLGFLKLRKRDMSAMLEASGWAVNYRMKMTRRLGKIFTRMPDVPKGATRERQDLLKAFVKRAGEKDFSWIRVIVTTLIAIAILGVVLYYYYPTELRELCPWIQWYGEGE